MGKMFIAHEGVLTLKCTKLDGSQKEEDKMEIKFQRTGWSAEERNKFEGTYEADSKQYKIYGKWNDCIWLEDLKTGDKSKVWEAVPRPENSEWKHHFTHFAMQSNHLTDRLAAKLPRTDSRFRPDQRALENGDWDLAASEKHRLEEK